jgi:hypothetical protein
MAPALLVPDPVAEPDVVVVAELLDEDDDAEPLPAADELAAALDVLVRVLAADCGAAVPPTLAQDVSATASTVSAAAARRTRRAGGAAVPTRLRDRPAAGSASPPPRSSTCSRDLVRPCDMWSFCQPP